MKRILDMSIRAALVLVAVAVVAILAMRFTAAVSGSRPAPVAHAGGGIDGKTYTNSIAALDASYRRGFRIFEMDFLTTLDKQFVCGHDWGHFGGAPLRSEDFEILRARMEYPPCTVDELAAWFQAHADSLLVSDVKTDVLELNAALAERLPEQLIGQAYDFDQICAFREAGVRRTILTLYRMPVSASALVSGLRGNCAGEGMLEAVTMYTDRVRRGHALLVKLVAGLPVYTHTINSCGAARWLYVLGADQVYTDFLPAQSCRLF